MLQGKVRYIINADISHLLLVPWTQQCLVCPQVSRQNDSEGSWVSLDVRKLLEFWFQAPSENLGIVIQATGPADPLGRSLLVTDLAEANGAMVSPQ